jgi:hypothetical protein
MDVLILNLFRLKQDDFGVMDLRVFGDGYDKWPGYVSMG